MVMNYINIDLYNKLCMKITLFQSTANIYNLNANFQLYFIHITHVSFLTCTECTEQPLHDVGGLLVATVYLPVMSQVLL